MTPGFCQNASVNPNKFQKSHTCWKLLTEIQSKYRTSGGAPKEGYAISKYFNTVSISSCPLPNFKAFSQQGATLQ